MKVVVALIFLFSVSVAVAQTNGFSQAWVSVDAAVKQGLFKKAVEALAGIEKQAAEQEQWRDAVKAVAQRADLETKLRGNKPEEVLPALQEAAERVPGPMRPFLEMLVAHHYWRYFLNNRDRFCGRTPLVSGADSSDIGTWSLQRILDEMEGRFRRALKYERLLKQVPVDAFDGVLERGTVPDAYRPTLYDFIVYEMIDFYALGELSGVRWEDDLELSAEGPALDDVPGFCFIIPGDAAKRSHVLRALQLFQDLLAFHEKDKDPAAYADADLNRLQFCYNQVSGQSRAERYAAALDRFARKWKAHDVSARACALRARLALAQGEPGLARMFAQSGAALYPRSIGAAQCRNLVAAIETPSVAFASEKVWCEPWPAMEIRYKNLAEAQFRAVPVSFEEMFTKPPQAVEQRQQTAAALLQRKPAKAWRVVLPPSPDYKEKTYRVSVPKDLSPGLYAVFASTDGTFVKEGGPVLWDLFLVSKLALVVEQRRDHVQGFVLTARDGVPVPGARVTVWRQDRNQKYKRVQTSLTGEDGAFAVLGEQAGELLMRAEKGGEAAQTWSPVWKGNEHEREQKPEAQVMFFTDRAIFRPGQTVQYKGIYFVTDQQNSLYHAVDGKTLTVLFNDANGQLIAEQTVRCNDFGSFSGSFAVPRDRGTGEMELRVEGIGMASFTVEEYKRPKFEVALEAPEGDARLGSVVSVAGHAVSYAGVPLGGAKVMWRVRRSVRLPAWCDGAAFAGEEEEMARGTALCDADGGFPITFFAQPDPKAAEKNEPVFTFLVTADVTDVTGETHVGSRRVALGYAAWQAGVSCDAWQTSQKPVALSVSLQTHDGDAVAGTGEMKVFLVDQPDQVRRPPQGACGRPGRFCGEAADDSANPENWRDGKEIASEPVQIGTNGVATGRVPLKAGLYRVRFEARDPSGKAVTARKLVHVIDPGAKKMRVKMPSCFVAESWRVEPGQTFRAVWGSGYDTAYALFIVEQNGIELLRLHTERGETQRQIELPVTEAMRGGLLVRAFFLRENRLYHSCNTIDVPWSNKQLALKWKHFTSRLEPGKKETWQAVINDARGDAAAAEVVATLYDRSLDAFVRQYWQPSFADYFSRSDADVVCRLENPAATFSRLSGGWKMVTEPAVWSYRSWCAGIGTDLGSGGRQRGGGRSTEDPFAAVPEAPGEESGTVFLSAGATAAGQGGETLGGGAVAATAAPIGRTEQGGCLPRRNLQETAFFLPHLVSGADGMVDLSFTMPETITGWRLMAFAHDRDLRGGYLEAEAQSAKDLMVEPNAPRFVREGDEVAFAVKLSNRSGKPLKGRARLDFRDAATLQGVDASLGNTQPEREFALAAGESLAVEWRLRIPDGQGFMTYQALAVTDTLVDGEEGWLPVLSRRVAVQESLALPIRGKKIKSFALAPLVASKGSKTIRHQSLTVQMVSRPAWYAVMALPYLMAYPHECCEQTFNRYYANALAEHIANSDPEIRKVFERWRGAEALKSPLEKNAEMRSVMLEETPWVREAEDETAARNNVGVLFEARRLKQEQASALKRLADARIADGAWPWFPGGPKNDFMTFYIVAGFGRLRQLGVPSEMGLALAALPGLDAWVAAQYKEALSGSRQTENHLSPTVALALYARSFFLKDRVVGGADQAAFAFFIGQAKAHGPRMGRQQQAQLALALKRWGEPAAAAAILKAARDTATVDDELGMFWRDAEQTPGWAGAPVETQALMIEALREVAGDAAAAEACQMWLLKQKQVQGWKSTKATADAVYALLLGGDQLLGPEAQVEVMLAGQPAKPGPVEAGTGFYEKRFGPAAIRPEMGEVTVVKHDGGVSWGAVTWQYLDDLDNVKPKTGTPLGITKRLFVKVQTAQGPVLRPATGVLPQGAELVTRLELRADRDMEFVHVKDSRASCAEPVNVLSRYRWQDGLGYYESTRDTASHFFIDDLPKGVYVFEYACRLQQKGTFSSGLAEIQCLYAPEFNGYAGNAALTVGQK